MKGASRFLSHWMLGLAIFIGGWSFANAAFQMLQLSAVALLLGAGFFSLLSGGTRRITLSKPEFVLGGAFTFAMLVAFVNGNPLSAMFGVMFLSVLISIALQIRQKDESVVKLIFRRVYVALIIAILVIQPNEFFTSLVGTVESGVGLIRFEPLGMHPNLSGLVYGGGCLLFLQHFLVTQRNTKKKYLSLVLSGFCMGVVLAASARAGLLALAVTGIVAMSLLAWRGSLRARKALAIFVLISLSVVAFKANVIAEYLTIILDLESSTRGMDSGATGRTALWEDGVTLIFSDPILMITGRGVRAAGPEAIGFPVESSYINLALEHGLPLSLMILIVFGLTIFRTLRNSVRGGILDSTLLLDGLMLLFILVQSIFNRYLIAIGNPYSLLTLFLLLRLNMRTRSAHPSRS